MKKTRDIKNNKLVQKFARTLKKINVAVTIILVLTTMFSYSATIINPAKFALPAFAGMAFPYILIIDILYTLLLIIAKKFTAIVMIGTIALGWKMILTTIQLNPMHYMDDLNEEDSTFTFMSFNVRLLNRYNWIKSKQDTKNKIFEFLNYENPEIVCFQEFYNNDKDSITNQDMIKELLESEYIVRDYNPEDTTHKTNKGYIIFSQFELNNKQPIFDHTDNMIGLSVDANIYNQKIRIFNVHLKSIKLEYDDYDFIDQIGNKNNKEQLTGIGTIYTKITKAYDTRVKQAVLLDSLIRKSPYPVIICGDFNEPSVSYCYKRIRGNLTDAFCESGTGFAETMRIKFLNFRIDYILHSQSLTSKRFRTHKENLSDHFAISCKFKINKQ